MHSTIRRLLLLAAALLALSLPASVQAGSGPSHFTGYNVGGWTETLDGCVRTNVWLGAGTSLSRFPPAAAEESSSLSLELEQYDMCSNPGGDPPATFVGVGDMQLDEGTLTGNMQSADLHVTVSVFENITETRVPVQLDLHWTGVGDVTKYPEVFHFGKGVNCHTMWGYRDATLSGTIQGAGIDVSGVFEHGGSLGFSKEGCTNQ
jgi:hypothetical protein